MDDFPGRWLLPSVDGVASRLKQHEDGQEELDRYGHLGLRGT